MEIEPRIEAETPFGPIWLFGRDTGRPALLVITGAFSSEDYFHKTAENVPQMDVFRAHLPGNHCPPLVAGSIGVMAAAYSHALAQVLPGRPMVVTGLSTGALVALALRGLDVRRMVLVEPVLTNRGVWPLLGFRKDMPPGGEGFVWEVFGIGPDMSEPRDYAHLLDHLTVPAHVLLGAVPLQPARHMEGMPSLVGEDVRARLAAHPMVSLQVLEGAGHNIPMQVPGKVLEAMRGACAAAFG